MLTTRFPFIYWKYQPCDKTLKIPSNRNFESCLSIRCLLLRTFSGFSIFAASFSFAFSNFVHWAVELKKNVSVMGYFSREMLIHRHRRQEVPLSHWSAVSGGELLVNIWFYNNHFGKFTGYLDLTDFRQILPKHSRNNEKQNYVEKFWCLKCFSCSVHLRYTPYSLRVAVPSSLPREEGTATRRLHASHTSRSSSFSNFRCR